MKGNLLELVEQCAPMEHNNTKVASAFKRASEMAALGFKKVAEDLVKKAKLEEKLNRLSLYKYVAITPDKIKAFLEAKADAYNKQYEGSKWSTPRADSNWHVFYTGYSTYRTVNVWGSNPLLVDEAPTTQKHKCFEAPTVHRSSTAKGTIGYFRWKEEKVEDYGALPPESVLKTYAEHKERRLFDYFTIASVEGIHDPLLLGRLNDDETRYYIAQWGDDVKLDDVI